MKIRPLLALSFVATVLGLPAARAINYAIIDLGEPVDSSGNPVYNWGIQATGVNNSGQVVGRINHAITGPGGAYNSFHSFLYSGGVMTDLTPAAGGDNQAHAINNAGQIAGQLTVETPSAAPAFRGYVRNTDGSFSLYNPPRGPYGHSDAWAINSSGQVAGFTGGGEFFTQGAGPALGPAGGGTWQPVTSFIPNTGPHGIHMQLSGLNDAGSFIGLLNNGHAFLHESSTTTDLGTLGGLTSRAFGISSSGMVVGEADMADGYVHAFSYTLGGGMVNLDLNGAGYTSHALAVSDTGVIVGTGAYPGSEVYAFVYTAADGMQDLNTLSTGSGWNLQYATAISDNGNYITGYGINPDGLVHSFLLTPATLSVPEPGTTALLLMLALPALAVARQRALARHPAV